MRYGAAGALRRAMRLKFKSGESGILPDDEDKICSARRRNFIAAKDKILSAKIGAGLRAR